MSPKKKVPAADESTSGSPLEHPTGPNVGTFEPSHGPNLADRGDTIDENSVPSAETEGGE
jgi:hypothetical protein